MSQLWSWRNAILASRLPATTKHVLMVISVHMNDMGEGCYPSTKRLSELASLSERSVCTHIESAIGLGWLFSKVHGFNGQGWARNEYRPAWPKGTEVGAGQSGKGTEPLSEGTEPGSKKALNDVQSIFPAEHLSRNSQSSKKPKSNAKTLTSLEQQFGNSPSLPAAYLDIATNKHGMSPDDAHRLWADFSDHYIAKNARWAGERGWSLTWQKWCRNRPQRGGGGPRQPFPTAGQRNARALVDDLAGWTAAIRDGDGGFAPLQPANEPEFVGSGDAGADHGLR